MIDDRAEDQRDENERDQESDSPCAKRLVRRVVRVGISIEVVVHGCPILRTPGVPSGIVHRENSSTSEISPATPPAFITTNCLRRLVIGSRTPSTVITSPTRKPSIALSALCPVRISGIATMPR